MRGSRLPQELRVMVSAADMSTFSKPWRSSGPQAIFDSGPGENAAHSLEGMRMFCGLLAVTGYASVCAFFRLANRVDIWVFWLLVSKPIIDLSWNLRFVEVLQQGVNLQTLVALLALFLSAAAIIQARERLIRLPPLTAFLAWALLAVVVTPTGWGINELLRLYSGAALFFVAGYALNGPEKLEKFTRVFLMVLLIPICLSFFQAMGILQFSYWDWADGQAVGRASGMYQTPLELVRYLIFGVPLALWLRGRSMKATFERWLATSFLCLSVPALFFTFHRAGWIVVGLEVLLWLVFTRKAGKAMIFTLALLAFGLLFSQRVESLFNPLTRAARGEIDLGGEEFLRGRGALWVIFLDSLFSSKPSIWFIGKGGSIAEGFVPGLADGTTNEPHNDFLRILHAYGIVGLGVYLAVLGKFVGVARNLRRRARGCFAHDVGTILLTVLTATAVMSITTEPMRYPTCVWYLFTLASISSLQLRGGAEPSRANA
jgi:O-antigen ligase